MWDAGGNSWYTSSRDPYAPSSTALKTTTGELAANTFCPTSIPAAAWDTSSDTFTGVPITCTCQCSYLIVEGPQVSQSVKRAVKAII